MLARGRQIWVEDKTIELPLRIQCGAMLDDKIIAVGSKSGEIIIIDSDLNQVLNIKQESEVEGKHQLCLLKNGILVSVIGNHVSLYD